MAEISLRAFGSAAVASLTEHSIHSVHRFIQLTSLIWFIDSLVLQFIGSRFIGSRSALCICLHSVSLSVSAPPGGCSPTLHQMPVKQCLRHTN
ncbi:hypothetical protein LDENG_00254180 [Lucifuga dentata]|nr:hypothetical protein LDENG_00254180 [Lucifuga dentata]